MSVENDEIEKIFKEIGILRDETDQFQWEISDFSQKIKIKWVDKDVKKIKVLLKNSIEKYELVNKIKSWKKCRILRV